MKRDHDETRGPTDVAGLETERGYVGATSMEDRTSQVALLDWTSTHVVYEAGHDPQQANHPGDAMSYDSEEPYVPSPPDPPEPTLSAAEIADVLGCDAADLIDLDRRRPVRGASAADGVWRATLSQAALRMAQDEGDALWGKPLDPVDDGDGEFYFGGWNLSGGWSIELGQTGDDVWLAVFAPRGGFRYGWRLAGVVTPPDAPLTPLRTALRETQAMCQAQGA